MSGSIPDKREFPSNAALPAENLDENCYDSIYTLKCVTDMNCIRRDQEISREKGLSCETLTGPFRG
jgi:hypothetical protein